MSYQAIFPPTPMWSFYPTSYHSPREMDADSPGGDSDEDEAVGLNRRISRTTTAQGNQMITFSPPIYTLPALPFGSPRSIGSGRRLLESPLDLALRTLDNSSSYTVGSFSTKQRRRPRHWRPDYAPPSTPWVKRNITRLRSCFSDEITRGNRFTSLNALLHCPSRRPATYYYDLRSSPFSSYFFYLPHTDTPVNQIALMQLATQPPVHELRLWHRRLPWIILVRSTQPNGIVVADVLGCLYWQLMASIGARDYYNPDMTAEDRERVENAYRTRCNGDLGMLSGGVKRVDFMEMDVGFLGLVKSRNGLWEIKTCDVEEGLWEAYRY